MYSVIGGVFELVNLAMLKATLELQDELRVCVALFPGHALLERRDQQIKPSSLT